MFQTIRNAWAVPEIRKKLLFTLLIIVIYRVGSAIPVPWLDPSALQQMVDVGGNFLSYLNILSGGNFSNATVFALGISPYITASIVIQLLTVAIRRLEQLAREGEDGRRKLNKITRYTTVGLAVVQSVAYYFVLRSNGALEYTSGFAGGFSAAVIILTFVAGAMLTMWLGERIDEKGLGNGISMILFAGIVARGPAMVAYLVGQLMLGGLNYVFVPLIVVIFVVLIGFIVLMTNAERRIPVQYAKRVVGRKMYGGQSTHIPTKVAMSGVMPIIFANALLSIPMLIMNLAQPTQGSFWYNFLHAFDYNQPVYLVLYFILILAFNYFYVAIQYNPLEMANNLRKNNGAIPGIRPGKPTSDFISKVISKITLIGALFLAVIALLPALIGAVTGMNIAIGGTSIIIVVGVALDTVRQLESQMMMRHYKGFLE